MNLSEYKKTDALSQLPVLCQHNSRTCEGRKLRICQPTGVSHEDRLLSVARLNWSHVVANSTGIVTWPGRIFSFEFLPPVPVYLCSLLFSSPPFSSSPLAAQQSFYTTKQLHKSYPCSQEDRWAGGLANGSPNAGTKNLLCAD